MSVPKVFVSSTCYDLVQIRSDLQQFIKSFGYEPVMSEYNGVTYNIKARLEEDCYSEIKNCDIIVGIIGGKFGSEATNSDGKSISMNEMSKAIQSNKQMYIFIDKNVYSEYSTYLKNVEKSIPIEYAYVDNVQIFEFIKTLKENPSIVINPFTTVSDITECLKSQWAGLFQNFLNTKERQSQNEGLVKIDETATKLNDLITNFQDTVKHLDDTVLNSLPKSAFSLTFVNHVLVEFSKTLFDCRATILVRNRSDIEKFLNEYSNFIVKSEDDDYITFTNEMYNLKVSKVIFDESNDIVYMSKGTFDKANNENNVFILEKNEAASNGDAFDEMPSDDDLPF